MWLWRYINTVYYYYYYYARRAAKKSDSRVTDTISGVPRTLRVMRSRRTRVSLLASPLHATRTALTRQAADASSPHPSGLSIASSAAVTRHGCYSHVCLFSPASDRHIYLMIFYNCGTRSFAKTLTTRRMFAIYDRLGHCAPANTIYCV